MNYSVYLVFINRPAGEIFVDKKDIRDAWTPDNPYGWTYGMITPVHFGLEYRSTRKKDTINWIKGFVKRHPIGRDWKITYTF